jgi:hypothetical protein
MSAEITINYRAYAGWEEKGASTESSKKETEQATQAPKRNALFSDAYTPSAEIMELKNELLEDAASFNLRATNLTETSKIDSITNDWHKSKAAFVKNRALNYWIENLSNPDTDLRSALYFNRMAANKSGTLDYRKEALDSLISSLGSYATDKKIQLRDENGIPTGKTLDLADYARADSATKEKYINDPVVKQALLKAAIEVRDGDRMKEALTYNREGVHLGHGIAGTLGTAGSIAGLLACTYGAYAGSAWAISAVPAVAKGGALGFMGTAAVLLSNPMGWVALVGIATVGILCLTLAAKTAIDSSSYINSGRNDLDMSSPTEWAGWSISNMFQGLGISKSKDFVPQHQF